MRLACQASEKHWPGERAPLLVLLAEASMRRRATLHPMNRRMLLAANLARRSR